MIAAKLIATWMAFLLHHAPNAAQLELAAAIADTSNETPVFAGDTGSVRFASLMTAIAFYESGFRNDAVGDGGRSVCAFQILNGPRSLLTDARACVSAGAAILAQSIRLAPAWPVAIYARGLLSAESRRISGTRTALASRLMGVTL